MWTLGSWAICAGCVILALRARTAGDHGLAVLAASLYNVPLVFLGNTGASGLYPVDFTIAAALAARVVTRRVVGFPAMGPGTPLSWLGLLTGYAVLRAAWDLLLGAAPDFARFELFGAYRWATFLVLFALGSSIGSIEEAVTLLRRLGFILCPYFLAAIPHQFGIFDLSGLEAARSLEWYERNDLHDDLARAFLGNNAATVGLVSFLGIVVGAILVCIGPKTVGLALFVVASGSLAFGGSRSDIIAAPFALVLLLIVGRRALRHAIGLACLATCLVVFAGSVFLAALDQLPYGLQRTLDSDVLAQASLATDGTFAYRIVNWREVMDFLLENPVNLAFGAGPNLYRAYPASGAGFMFFGHNVFVHTVGELGIVGLILTAGWFMSVGKVCCPDSARRGFPQILGAAGLALLTQRLVAGIAVDSIFAIDNMICVNAFILILLGTSVSLQSRWQRDRVPGFVRGVR